MAKASSWSCVTNRAVACAALRMRADLVRQPLAQVDVEVGEGLVQQQQLRLAAPARAPAPRAAAARRTARAGSGARCRPGRPAASTSATRASRSALRQAMDAEADVAARRRCGGTGRSPGTPCRCAALRRARGRRRRPPAGPEMRISPAVTRSRPATARSRVVLPQPDGPISTPMSPARRPNETSSTAGCGPAGVLDAQLGDLDEHERDCRCLQFSFASTGLAPAPMALRRLQDLLLAAAGARCWCCRCWPCWLPGCSGTPHSAPGPGRDGAHRAARLCRGPAWACAWSSASGVALVGRRNGRGRDAVRLSRPPDLRMGAAAAAGDARVRGGLCVHRLPAVQRAAADPGCAAAFGLQGGSFPRCAASAAPPGCSSSRSTPTSTCWRARRWASGPAT